MKCPTFSELPEPGVKTGWPWIEILVDTPQIKSDDTPWPRSAINSALHNLQGEDQMVLINAWDEWAEGNI